MAETGEPPSGREPDAAPDRCPACDGPLQLVQGQPERFCPKCGIFVEYLQPLSASPASADAGPETVARRLELAKLHATFEAFAGEDGKKAAQAPPEGPETPPPPQEARPEPERAPPVPTPEVLGPELPAQAVLPPPAKEIKALPAAPVPVESPEYPREGAPEPPPPPEPWLPYPIPMELLEPPAPEPKAAPEPMGPEPTEPEPAEAESTPGEAGEGGEELAVQTEPAPPDEIDVFECPRCRAEVAPDAPRCPSCGTRFGKAVVVGEPVPPAPIPPVIATAKPQAAVTSARKARLASLPSRGDRAIFYTGAALIAFGGSGLMLGSFLHDFFRVPYVGHAYDAFGPVNLVAFLFGSVFVVAGAVAMAVGARRRSGRKSRPQGATT